MAIQFNCPYCTAPIRVPDTAAGKKGSCPKCGTKVLVPTPAAPPAPEPEPAPVFEGSEPAETAEELPDVHKQVVKKVVKKVKKIVKKVKKKVGPGGGEVAGEPEVEEIVTEEVIVPAAPVISDEPAGAGSASGYVSAQLRRRRKRRGSPAWLLLMFLIGAGVVVGLLVMLWQQNQQTTLKGELSGEPVTYPKVTPGFVSRQELTLPAEDLTAVLTELEQNELRIQSSSSLVVVVIRASGQGLQIGVEPGREGSWYRIDATSDPELMALVQENRGEWDTLRSDELTQAANSFVREKQQLDASQKASLDVGSFRDPLGLNSLVSGLGYVVEVRVDGFNHRCVYEDSNNRLYFLLPAGLRTLQLRARVLPDGTKAFDGEFVVKFGKEVEDDGKPTGEPMESPEDDDIPGLGEMKPGS